MTNDTYAGLSEAQANEALCAWLNERLRETKYQSGGNSAIYVFSAGGMPLHHPPFFASHDSIHRVLDAMNDEERIRWAEKLASMAMADPARPVGVSPAWHALFATPAQKTVAALRALGLGKEEG